MKRGPGRPKVKPSKKQSHIVALRVNGAELRHMKRLAKMRHQSVSAMIRSILIPWEAVQ
jgi:hypothetical protein